MVVFGWWKLLVENISPKPVGAFLGDGRLDPGGFVVEDFATDDVPGNLSLVEIGHGVVNIPEADCLAVFVQVMPRHREGAGSGEPGLAVQGAEDFLVVVESRVVVEGSGHGRLCFVVERLGDEGGDDFEGVSATNIRVVPGGINEVSGDSFLLFGGFLLGFEEVSEAAIAFQNDESEVEASAVGGALELLSVAGGGGGDYFGGGHLFDWVWWNEDNLGTPPIPGQGLFSCQGTI